MTLSLSVVADSAVNQMFASLDGLLQKGAAAAEAAGVEESVYLNWRLAPDMFALTRQVQIATELPARGLSRLAGTDLPTLPDDETTFAALRDRIVKARAHIKALSADAIDADPEKEMTFPVGPEMQLTMRRAQYLQTFILPNLYFHVSAAYMILRHLGVELGKRDFLAMSPE